MTIIVMIVIQGMEVAIIPVIAINIMNIIITILIPIGIPIILKTLILTILEMVNLDFTQDQILNIMNETRKGIFPLGAVKQ